MMPMLHLVTRLSVMCRNFGAALLLLAASVAPEARAQSCPATCAGFAPPAPGAFSRAMPVTAAIYVGDASHAEDRRDDPSGKLAACIGGTLRGAASASMVGGRAVYFLNVEGEVTDIGAPVSFRYCSAQDGDLVADVTPSFNADDTPTFDPAGFTGSPSAPYRLEADPAALPVELMRFVAAVSGDAVALAWETASETNNAGFHIETRGGEAWRELGFVAGAGTTLEARAYRFAVLGLAPGAHRFRLRQVDYDGASEYSAEVEVTVGLGSAFDLRASGAHPARERAAFVLTVGAPQHVEAEVFDLAGRRVAQVYAGAVREGEPLRLVWEAKASAPGVYVLRVRGKAFGAARTFVVH